MSLERLSRTVGNGGRSGREAQQMDSILCHMVACSLEKTILQRIPVHQDFLSASSTVERAFVKSVSLDSPANNELRALHSC